MKNYAGTIIEESLDDTKVLNQVRIVSTRVSKVTNRHQTPWLKQWTLHTVKIASKIADTTAQILSLDLERKHPWFADFKNGKTHYIVFPHKIFKVDMQSKEQYDLAKAYGISLGIPDYQVDFQPLEQKKKFV